VKVSFYEELERIFNKLSYLNILLGDFNTKVGREDIFKPTTGNEILHKISNDNEVKVVNPSWSVNFVAYIRPGRPSS
jgi:hypothetical protein